MTDFKVEFENRFYTVFLESSVLTNPEVVDVKIIMYCTVYNIFKDKRNNTWNNHISKFELSKGLLEAIGHRLDEFLKL